MNTRPSVSTLAVLAFAAACVLLATAQPRAAAPAAGTVFEYATVRWDGPDNTHVIRPDGTVQSAGPQLRELRLPARTDGRAFYLNAVLNALAREGYELVATAHDHSLILRRPAR